MDKKTKVLPSKWVFTVKRGLNGELSKYEAGVVAGGQK